MFFSPSVVCLPTVRHSLLMDSLGAGFAGGGLVLETAQPARSMGHLRSRSEPLAAQLDQSSAGHAPRSGFA